MGRINYNANFGIYNRFIRFYENLRKQKLNFITKLYKTVILNLQFVLFDP